MMRDYIQNNESHLNLYLDKRVTFSSDLVTKHSHTISCESMQIHKLSARKRMVDPVILARGRKSTLHIQLLVYNSLFS